MRIGIIGGGPGGAVTAATLARLGHEVHVFESEVFPRFHIGESLLPCNMPIYEDLGLDRRIFGEQQHFMPKLAAYFELVGTGRTCRFPFADGMPGDPPSIYQVERSKFDHMLLTHAVASGATLHCPVTITRVELPEAPSVPPVLHFTQADGAAASLTVDFVVDCSGRETLIGRQLGLVDREGDLMRAAVFGHVAELPLAPDAQRGDIVISKCPAGWSWQIPLEEKKWSVGLVLKRDAVIKGGTPADVFRTNLSHFPELRERLNGQVPEPVRAMPNISYRVRQRIGPRWALVGDAGGFIDPIFSSGVLLATRAGWRLGKALHEQGADANLDAWRDATDHDLATFFAFIRLWYDGHFIDNLFFSDNREPSIYHGIISLLAGNTTNLDNQFLAMLNRRISTQKTKTLILN